MVSSRSVLLLVCGAIFVALIANAATNSVNVNALIENDRMVAHTHKVKERLASLMATSLDAQSSMRGYVITGDRSFLQPFKRADKRIDEELTALGHLVRDNPPQTAAVDEMRRLTDEHRQFLREAVNAVDEKGTEAASDLVKSGRGQTMMQSIRQRMAAMTDVEDHLLEERAHQSQQRYRQATIAGIVGAGLSVSITGLAFLLVWREFRRRREVEAALKAQADEASLSAERFRLLTETSPIHIWMSQADGAVVFLNRSWQDYTGLSASGAGLADWMTAIHPDDAGRLQAIWARHDGGSKTIYIDEVRVRRAADQSYRWHRCAVVPVRTRGGVLRSWVGTLTDIQSQKDAAEALEQAVNLRTQELRRANNMLQEEVLERIRAEERARAVAIELRRSNEELEKFAYVASHDLQEPLRKIQAFGDRLDRKSRQHLDEQSREYLNRMLTSATRMRTLIDDLLAFSRVATNLRPYAKVDLNALAADIVGDFETALAHSQGRVDVKPLPTIEADPPQMRQLLQNLIGNALKFAKPGEPPVVTLAATRLDDLPASADPAKPSFSGWRLTVADQGIGFEQIHEKRIFEVFQRLHGRDHYEGTGIGLAICRKIVERHGGAIHARGEPDVGATFFIDLPDAPPPSFVVPTEAA